VGLQLLAGPGESESIAYSLSLPEPRHKRLQDFRVVVLDEHPLVPTSKAARRPVGYLASHLAACGVRIEVSTPLLPNLAEATRNCLRLLTPMTLARVSDEQYDRLAERSKELIPDDDSLAALALRAGTGSYRDWTRANETRARLFHQWKALFRHFDLVICPVSPTLAFVHDDNPLDRRTIDIDGERISYMNQIAWAALATGSGLPVTTVPFRFPDQHLPSGVQIIGPYLEDRTCLYFAQLIEERFTSFTAPNAFRS
jgi:amidase